MENIQIFDRNILTFIYFQSPFMVSFIFLLFGLASLYFCPEKLKKIELQTNHGKIDVGFYASYNWTIVHSFLAPFSFFILLSLYESLPGAFKNLIDSGVLRTTGTLPDMISTINREIKKFDGVWILILFFGTFVLNCFDYFSYYFEKDHTRENTKVKDWTVAFQKWNGSKISKRRNLSFNLLMYTQQWLITFIAAVFIYKAIRIVSFLYFVSIDKYPQLLFKINYSDVYHQYGFWGLNTLYIYLLLLVMLFLAYLTIIRFVHYSRKVEWKFFPKYLTYTVMVLFLMGTFAFFIVVDKNLKNGRNLSVVELLLKKDRASVLLKGGSISGLQYIELSERAKAIDDEIKLVLAQKILPSNLQFYYIIIAIYVLQLRFIIFPPKSWLDGLKAIFNHEF